MNRSSSYAALCAFAMLGLGVSGDSYASGTCGEHYCTGLVSEITLMSGRVRIALDLSESERAKLSNCGLVNDRYFILWPTHNLYKEMFATLRSAQLAEREVLIRTLTTAECDVDYIRAF